MHTDGFTEQWRFSRETFVAKDESDSHQLHMDMHRSRTGMEYLILNPTTYCHRQTYLVPILLIVVCMWEACVCGNSLHRCHKVIM